MDINNFFINFVRFITTSIFQVGGNVKRKKWDIFSNKLNFPQIKREEILYIFIPILFRFNINGADQIKPPPFSFAFQNLIFYFAYFMRFLSRPFRKISRGNCHKRR